MLHARRRHPLIFIYLLPMLAAGSEDPGSETGAGDGGDMGDTRGSTGHDGGGTADAGRPLDEGGVGDGGGQLTACEASGLTCGEGQRCDATRVTPAGLDNTCEELACPAGQDCRPAAQGSGQVCVQAACRGDVDCEPFEHCDGATCRLDTCEPLERVCDGDTVVSCSASGAPLDEPLFACIWNQQSYHVTNVTEGGGIPLREAESWRLLNGPRRRPAPRSLAPGRMSPYAADMSSLRRLLEYSREFRPRYVRGTLYAVINKVFDIAPEILIGMAVDVVVKRDRSFLGNLGVGSLSSQLVLLGTATVLIWAGESFFQYLYAVEWRNLAQALQHKARTDVYDHVQHLQMQELSSRRQGELQTILTEDVNQLERFLNDGLVAIIHVVTSTLLVSAVFFYISPVVAAFAMLPIPLIVVVALWFQRGLSTRYAAVRDSAGKLGARITSQLHGIPTLKSYTAQEQALVALQRDSQHYEGTNRSAIKLSSAFVPLIRMAVLSGFVVTLVYGGFRTLDGTLAVGAYSVLVFLTQRLLWPFTRLGETVDLYQRSMASADRLLDVLSLEREHAGAGEEVSPALFSEDIVFDDVGFAYEAESPVLEHVSLRIAGGSFVGLVGSTGSGKSTLVKMLLRFYAPSTGEVRIGGRPLNSLRIDDLRRNVAWVSQEAFVFHGSIHDNIALGSGGASRDAVERAAQAAELHDFVLSLPRGYDTLVGDFGSTLSGGQRQRLSIARAVLKDPPILILDEATSAVDNDTEAAIQRSIARISRGRTVLAVAHRLSTIRAADALFVLEGGKVVEAGTHEALVEARGRYARLWAMQIGEV